MCVEHYIHQRLQFFVSNYGSIVKDLKKWGYEVKIPETAFALYFGNTPIPPDVVLLKDKDEFQKKLNKSTRRKAIYIPTERNIVLSIDGNIYQPHEFRIGTPYVVMQFAWALNEARSYFKDKIIGEVGDFQYGFGIIDIARVPIVIYKKADFLLSKKFAVAYLPQPLKDYILAQIVTAWAKMKKLEIIAEA